MGWCEGAHVAYALDGRYVLLFSFFAPPSPTMEGAQFYISILRLKKGRALMRYLPFSLRRSPFPLSGVRHRFPWDDGSSEHVSVDYLADIHALHSWVFTPLWDGQEENGCRSYLLVRVRP